MMTFDLGEWRRNADAMYPTLSAAEREALHAEYVAAGWKTCPHGTDCPPWNCEQS